MKTIIISQPKSGTFLCANLLTLFGITFNGVFLSETRKQVYDLKNIDNKTPVSSQINLKKSLKQVSKNEVVVSHLMYTSKNIEAVKEFKKIFVYRDREEIQASWDNWAKIIGKRPAKIGYDLQRMLFWKNEKCFCLSFSDMIEINEKKLDELQVYLFGEVKYNSEEAMRKALEMDSLTKARNNE